MTFMSGIVFVHRKGMDFKVRHGLYIEKGHDILVQAWSLYIERAWFINSSIVPHITQSSTIASLFTVWVPTKMCVGQALSVLILILFLIPQIKDLIPFFIFTIV